MNRKRKPISPIRYRPPLGDIRNTAKGLDELRRMITDSERRDREKQDEGKDDDGK